MMAALRILVVGAEPATARFLSDHLIASRFEVTYTRPGSSFVAAASSAPVAFAVVDGIDQRPHAAQMEIAVLKQLHPEVQVIAISTCSSEKDASIVELGILYYLAGQSPEKLLRVIEAAADINSPNGSPPCNHPQDRPSRR